MDPTAAREVMSRTGQMGVPVMVADGETIIGFDRAALERLAIRWAPPRPEPVRFGVAARDAAGGGAEVGRVNAGQPAERAGVRPGDVVTAINGRPIGTLDDLNHVLSKLVEGASFTVNVRRAGQQTTLRVPGS